MDKNSKTKLWQCLNHQQNHQFRKSSVFPQQSLSDRHSFSADGRQSRRMNPLPPQRDPQNILEFFARVQIINLYSRKDRRQETELEFQRYGFPINTEKVSFFDAICPTSPEGFSHASVRGCFLSHKKIVEEAQKHGLKNILILEDDICFSKYILEYGAIAIESLKKIDWDIAYFGHNLGHKSSEIAWREVNKPILLAHFYAINGKILQDYSQFLKRILERPPGHPDGGPMHYDGALNTFRQHNPNVKAYYISHSLGYQRPSKTDLHQGSFLDRYKFFNPMMSFLRTTKRYYLRHSTTKSKIQG